MTATLLLSVTPTQSNGKAGGDPQRTATMIGSMSILLWAIWPSLAIYAAPAPTFQILAIGQAVGFLTLAVMRIIRKERLREMMPQSWGLLFFGIIGILGTNVFNFLAITRIPAAQASVINYTWPMMALFIAGALSIQKLNMKHYFAIALGFAGVIFVVNPFASLEFDALGIGMALLAAVCYASYTLYRQVDHRSPSDAVGVYGLVAAIVCAGIHFGFETTQTLNGAQWLAIIALGIAPMGLAYAVWDYGVARGDARAMSILAYGTPLIATLLLVFLGLAELTLPLLIGAVLIIGGAALGTWKHRVG